jgi:hypothetical protein
MSTNQAWRKLLRSTRIPYWRLGDNQVDVLDLSRLDFEFAVREREHLQTAQEYAYVLLFADQRLVASIWMRPPIGRRNAFELDPSPGPEEVTRAGAIRFCLENNIEIPEFLVQPSANRPAGAPPETALGPAEAPEGEDGTHAAGLAPLHREHEKTAAPPPPETPTPAAADAAPPSSGSEKPAESETLDVRQLIREGYIRKTVREMKEEFGVSIGSSEDTGRRALGAGKIQDYKVGKDGALWIKPLAR